MAEGDVFANDSELAADLNALEIYRWYRMIFAERISAASMSQDEDVLFALRLEATYQLAEFYYVLKARRIGTESQIRSLAELHNHYIVDLTKNRAKMDRLGLNEDRLLSAMFTSDTLPRLLQNWRERPGAIDQSNLARLMAVVMSTETCRKVVLACAEAGFLMRERTSYGTIVILSGGVLEDVLGRCIREARRRVEDLRDREGRTR
jgi:hypothetical protein